MYAFSAYNMNTDLVALGFLQVQQLLPAEQMAALRVGGPCNGFSALAVAVLRRALRVAGSAKMSSPVKTAVLAYTAGANIMMLLYIHTILCFMFSVHAHCIRTSHREALASMQAIVREPAAPWQRELLRLAVLVSLKCVLVQYLLPKRPCHSKRTKEVNCAVAGPQACFRRSCGCRRIQRRSQQCTKSSSTAAASPAAVRPMGGRQPSLPPQCQRRRNRCCRCSNRPKLLWVGI